MSNSSQNSISLTKRSSYIYDNFSWIFSIIYALVLNSGYLGFGIDVVVSYDQDNDWWSSELNELLGWFISTFHVVWNERSIYIGVFLVSILLSHSIFLLSKKIILPIYGPTYAFTIAGLLHLSYPILLGSLNVLRQGLAMGFFYIGICCLLDQKKNKALFFMMLSIWSHNSLALFSIITLGMYFFNPLINFVLIAGLTFFMIYFGSEIKSTINTLSNQMPAILSMLIAYIVVNIRFFFSFFKLKNKRASKFKEISKAFFWMVAPILVTIDRPSVISRLFMIWLIPVIFLTPAIFGNQKKIVMPILVLFCFVLALISLNSSFMVDFLANVS